MCTKYLKTHACSLHGWAVLEDKWWLLQTADGWAKEVPPWKRNKKEELEMHL